MGDCSVAGGGDGAGSVGAGGAGGHVAEPAVAGALGGVAAQLGDHAARAHLPHHRPRPPSLQLSTTDYLITAPLITVC